MVGILQTTNYDIFNHQFVCSKIFDHQFTCFQNITLDQWMLSIWGFSLLFLFCFLFLLFSFTQDIWEDQNTSSYMTETCSATQPCVTLWLRRPNQPHPWLTSDSGAPVSRSRRAVEDLGANLGFFIANWRTEYWYRSGRTADFYLYSIDAMTILLSSILRLEASLVYIGAGLLHVVARQAIVSPFYTYKWDRSVS
jgi:hypothetical protein